MGDISAGHLDMLSTESKVVECTPMSSFNSRGTELDPLNEENALLPDIITMNCGNLSSPSDQKRIIRTRRFHKKSARRSKKRRRRRHCSLRI